MLDFGAVGVVVRLVQAIVAVAQKLRANRAAAAALARRAELVAAALANQLSDGHSQAVAANLAALESVLTAIERFLAKTAALSTMRQVLLVGKTADAIRDLDVRLVQQQQTLQLAVALQTDAVAKAAAQDTAELPALIEQLMSGVDARLSQQLETLQAIATHQTQLLERLPATLQPRVAALLDNTKQDIVARSGRGLSAPQAWTVAADDVDIFWDSQIGEGVYGWIFRGEGSGMHVAVKVVAETLGREGVDLIQKEAAVWFPLHHPNVLRLWRVCLNADKPFIVMPLMRDDVAGFLRKAPAMSMAVRTHFLAGAARGMQYLHELSPPIIHGDLKANNVLVGDDGDARITDFGLALVKASVSATTKRKTGAVRWIAPEKYKRGYKQALAQDVFSFGMTAYQIVSGKVPFAEEVHDDIVKDWIKDGERPDRPDGVPDALWSIIDECWRHEPEQRPAFRDIAWRLSMLPQDKPQLSVPGDKAAVAVPRVSAAAATAALAALRMHDSGFASSQPEISDAERLVQAFPAWCASKGITAANAQRFDATVKNGSAGSLKMLEWENNKLVALRLKNQGLEGPLTPLIGGFRHLRSLWLDQNKITSLPDSIGSLKELTHLYVLQTRLHLMAMFSRTRCRDLTSNQLSSLPASLGGLSKLQGLFVGRNKLTVVTEQIGSLKGLLKLSLNFNQLSTLPASIGSLTKLQAFWVGHNKLTVVPEWTGNLKELTNLDFEANQISEFPESIGELTKLQELWAGENKLTGVPSSMGNLMELATLSLSQNQLWSLPHSLNQLKKLKTLYLYGNPVSTDQLKAFITPYK
ncbi:hypothetical protein HK105_209362 [Polyrhizophydium stewartii]|uniref:non-specific serine/threonine protein kinase n=1 Tax=Polyrhizophydium stewartii TaxID=2732419 RepID=A0ABR4MV99_9FUNG